MLHVESMNEKAILVELLEANFDITIKTQYFANVTNQEYIAHLKIHSIRPSWCIQFKQSLG